MADPKIDYPYLPKNREIKYLSSDNKWMREAKEFAEENSLDPQHPTGSVIVVEDEVIGRGANGSNYHDKHGCERKKLSIPTGEGYELCEGCHPKNHSEPRAIKDAVDNGYKSKLAEASLILWGHWWLCESCWDAIIGAGIKGVYLMEGSKEKFDKSR